MEKLGKGEGSWMPKKMARKYNGPIFIPKKPGNQEELVQQTFWEVYHRSHPAMQGEDDIR